MRSGRLLTEDFPQSLLANSYAQHEFIGGRFLKLCFKIGY